MCGGFSLWTQVKRMWVVKWMDGTTVQIVCTHIYMYTHNWYYHGTCVTTDIQEMSTI